ncbi:TonB-dependent siderophore receptor [Limnohabitans sp. 103DPR2]|uniref:TonB-dependent siderophore receptor n=1 Tax=Limnohabitans sp. 103DPR2 TaxID=1678129 RepID=UPI0006DCD2AC|nr:TonB-dependent receptor [Limnohabitans sp. 103DPR2]ALK93078.1 Vitamin B12 transporter BtuB precursor [Limnohabitans sp. 103DPR2]
MSKRMNAIVPNAVALACALTVAHMGSAWAQTAPNNDTLKLDELVVTGTASGASKMKQSNSISTVGVDQILQAQPTNSSDILRTIPGVRAESSGGGGNANVTVRGLPISAGGARYVQFQEDGLPVLLFGDVAFATPDMFLRADGSLERLEVVRGGSASTLGTNAPGGIINFISKTGEEPGGSMGVTTGLGYDEKRFDFDYSGKLGEKTRFFVGGYANMGQGPRNASANGVQGHQIKANITQDVDNGFVRLNFKTLDDKSPLFMPAPVSIKNGVLSELPGIDPRKATFYSPYWVQDATLSKNNTLVNSNVNDGLRVKSDSFGVETELKLAGGWKLSEKFRTSENSGRFISIFPGDDVANAASGSKYATGPKKGQAYTGKSFTATVFNTSMDDMGSTTNDVKLSKTFAQADGSKITTTAGLFVNVQKVALTWNFNQYLMEATDNNPALLANSKTNSYGAIDLGTNVWGGCCTRAIDGTYRTTSPYAVLGWEKGALSLDGSLRADQQVATGSYNQASNNQFKPENTQAINYTKNFNSYSFGGNYQLDKDTALFARVSKGAAFNADRIMFDPKKMPLDGSGVVPINEVKQVEGGVKLRNGNLSTFVTLFNAKTDESNYDATTQKSTSNKYDASGVEVEAGYKMGAFRINGGVTVTDAKIVATGLTPNRQAKVVYQLSPSYVLGDATIGAAIVGTSSSKDAQGSGYDVTLPAYTVINAFANFNIGKNAVASLGVNNLTNVLGYTESNDGRMAARAINGRSIKAGLKYNF